MCRSMACRTPWLLALVVALAAGSALATSVSEWVNQANNLQGQEQTNQTSDGCAPAIILLGIRSEGVTGIGKLLPSNPVMVRFNQEGDRLSGYLAESRRIEDEMGEHQSQVFHCEALIKGIEQERETLASYKAQMAATKDPELRKNYQEWIDACNQKLAELLKEGDVQALADRLNQHAQAVEQAQVKKQKADATAQQQSIVVDQAYQAAERAARACPEN
jgi:hypothetical protein